MSYSVAVYVGFCEAVQHQRPNIAKNHLKQLINAKGFFAFKRLHN